MTISDYLIGIEITIRFFLSHYLQVFDTTERKVPGIVRSLSSGADGTPNVLCLDSVAELITKILNFNFIIHFKNQLKRILRNSFGNCFFIIQNWNGYKMSKQNVNTFDSVLIALITFFNKLSNKFPSINNSIMSFFVRIYS